VIEMQDQYGRDVKESVELGWLVYSGSGNHYAINSEKIKSNPAAERNRIEKAINVWLEEYKRGFLPKLRDIIDDFKGEGFDDMPFPVKVHWYSESGIEGKAVQRLSKDADWAGVRT